MSTLPNPDWRPLGVAAAAANRRSVREYSLQPVTDATVRELLQLTGRAPSAWNLQPWRFVVVRDAGLKHSLGLAANRQAQIASAPLVIVLYSDMEDSLRRFDKPKLQAHFARLTPEECAQWGNAQANIALGYLLLIAEGMDLATSPMLGFDAEAVRDLVGLPPRVPVAALIALGYGEHDGSRNARWDVDQLTIWS